MKHAHPSQSTNRIATAPDRTPCRTDGSTDADRARRVELARLLPLWPKELHDFSAEGRRHIISALERALRTERKRCRQRHWAYDVARHSALVRTWRAECAALRLIDIKANVTRKR
jgi:hypothetical protein